MPAAVYFRADDFVLHALLRTEYGALIAGLPAIVVSRSSGAAELVATLRLILGRSRGTVPHPTDWKDFGRPVLAAIRESSWKALSRGTRYCSITEVGDALVFLPTRNGGVAGPDRGFHGLSDQKLSLERQASDSAIADALARTKMSCS